MFIMTYNSPIGPLYIAEQDGAISHLVFSPLVGQGGATGEHSSPLLKHCREQLDAYFDGTLQAFDLPLAPSGTPFQLRVWQALRTIPCGSTWSYKMLAEAAGSPRGYRAVGLANNRNPISILVPCHRVIGASGALTGYGGGLSNKEYLLKLEGATL